MVNYKNDFLTVDLFELDRVLNPKESISTVKYEIKRERYINLNEDKALKDMMKYIPCEDSLRDYYRKMEQDNRFPDLLGKTIEVNSYQFKEIHEIVVQMSETLNIIKPRVFVYEDLYYRAEVDGIDYQWIEISSKLIEDFTEDELKFILGKQLACIQSKHYYYESISRAILDVIENVDRIPGVRILNVVNQLDIYKAFLKANINRWRRIVNYSTDSCGLLLCDSPKAAVSAINKQILNNSSLINEIDIKEYIKKAEEIQRIRGTMVNSTKLDETVPYGPYRILELLRYASSIRCKNTLAQL